ncbi:M20/M25/M40 family metallo-hydrolase [Myceligenerans crystallogenes]|uniref:M28 family metallopeptidase n=1 Tax=Myceligenerans crystallogenes TaxID=316335 RepID=A0ABP4ZRV2_9MICO
MKATRWIPVLATMGLVLGTTVTAPAVAAPEVPPSLEDRIRTDGVVRHLEAFQEIADENGGNRSMGTPGYEASGAYVERRLRAAGYETERQYFEVEQFTVTDLSVTVPGVELDPIAMTYSRSTPDAGVTAPVVVPAIANGCAVADGGSGDPWAGVDVAGKIALIQRGTCTFGAKSRTAAAAGAAAVIIYNNTAGTLNGTLGGSDPALAPTVGVTQAEGEAILAARAADPALQAFFDLQAVEETKQTFNVLAETSWGDAGNVVMLGAHLDSVEEGAGINDNGTGSAGILETAIQLAKVGRAEALPNKVRFAWWGAEELGLQGSNHYVASLSAAEQDDIALYMNFDMIGSPNYTIGVYDADQSTYEAPVTVPEGSAAVEAAFTGYFDSGDQPWVDSPFSGRSDYQGFILAGIPASGLFTGADAIKTDQEAAIFGGTAGIPLDPNYHSAADDLTNVDTEALTIMSKAIGHATHEFARSTDAVGGN